MSNAELLLATQLDQAGIPYVREFVVAPPRKCRADFYIARDLLVEVDGGAWIGGRHSRGGGVETDCEKSACRRPRLPSHTRDPAQVDDGRALDWIRAAVAWDRKWAA